MEQTSGAQLALWSRLEGEQVADAGSESAGRKQSRQSQQSAQMNQVVASMAASMAAAAAASIALAVATSSSSLSQPSTASDSADSRLLHVQQQAPTRYPSDLCSLEAPRSPLSILEATRNFRRPQQQPQQPQPQLQQQVAYCYSFDDDESTELGLVDSACLPLGSFAHRAAPVHEQSEPEARASAPCNFLPLNLSVHQQPCSELVAPSSPVQHNPVQQANPDSNSPDEADASPSKSHASAKSHNGAHGASRAVCSASSSAKHKRLYKCRHCPFETDRKSDNWQHIRIHMRPEKVLACESCQFVTEYKHHLEYHQRNHSGYKPFKCDNCDYQCVNKSMLNSHMKSHSSVYQYQCGDCKYATKYVHSLKMHLRKYNHQPAQLMIDVYGRKRGPKSSSSSSSSSNAATASNEPQQAQNALGILDLRVDSKL